MSADSLVKPAALTWQMPHCSSLRGRLLNLQVLWARVSAMQLVWLWLRPTWQLASTSRMPRSLTTTREWHHSTQL